MKDFLANISGFVFMLLLVTTLAGFVGMGLSPAIAVVIAVVFISIFFFAVYLKK